MSRLQYYEGDSNSECVPHLRDEWGQDPSPVPHLREDQDEKQVEQRYLNSELRSPLSELILTTNYRYAC